MMKHAKEHALGELTRSPYINGATAGTDVRAEHDATQPKAHILIIDDEVLAREQLERFYTSKGYTVEIAGSGRKGLDLLNSSRTDLVILDIELAGLSGAEVIDQLQRNHPGVSVILTGYWPIDRYHHELHYGAYDYMAKPFEHDTIHETTECALQKAYVFSESSTLRNTLNDTEGEFGQLLSRTPAMHEIFETIRMVSRTDMTVLLEGEAGTGKELVANAIHHQSSRRAGPFIPVNCAGFPDSLLEIELFGCEDGARFRDEIKRPGKIKLADGGTLFLDEIESMAPFVQSKFLQVLEDCSSVHLGGQQSLDSDVRVIAASNVPLQELIAHGKMRADLYYRINVVPIHVLPLRERSGDIPLLIDDFLRWHPIANQKRIVGVSRETMSRLIQYPWPGNIRELRNVLEKGIVFTKGSVIENIDLPVGKEPVNRDAGTFT